MEMSARLPLVSVVVTTFNHERYIAEAINSVLAQTYRHLEIIVVDDGSIDHTPDVLREFGDAIAFIRQPNEGIAGSRNRGIREARGELLAFLDGDDRWHPCKLSRQVEAFLRFPDAGLIACDTRSFDDDRVIRDHLLVLNDAADSDVRAPIVNLECFERLVRGNIISTTSQIMIPRRVLDDVGLSDTTFPIASDYDLYLRIALKYPFTFVREALADYRYVPTSASGPDDVRLFRWTRDVLDVLRKQKVQVPAPARALFDVTLRQKTRYIARLAYYRGCDGHRKWALDYLWHVLSKSADPIASAYFLALMIPARVRQLAAPMLGSTLRRCE